MGVDDIKKSFEGCIQVYLHVIENLNEKTASSSHVWRIFFYVPRILENDIENLEVGLARAVHINARRHHYFFHTN